MKKDKDQEEEQIYQNNQSNYPGPPTTTNQPQTIFGNKSITMKCPFCLNNIQTEIILKPQLSSMLFGFLIFSLIPSMVMLVFIVIILQITATRKHRCSLCEKQLGSDGKFLLIFTDQLYSFTFAGSGILISKKIIISIAFILVIILILFYRIYIQEYNIQWMSLTWQQLVATCPTTASLDCFKQYQDKNVKNWKGFVMKIEDNRESFRRFYSHAVSIYIKMKPQQKQQSLPDILITADSAIVYSINEILDNLKHGDEVIFNGTFKAMKKGDGVGMGRHFHLINLNVTGNNDPNTHIYINNKEIQQFQKHGLLRQNSQKVVQKKQITIEQTKTKQNIEVEQVPGKQKIEVAKVEEKQQAKVNKIQQSVNDQQNMIIPEPKIVKIETKQIPDSLVQKNGEAQLNEIQNEQ